MGQSFARCGIDVYGPLPMSKKGNRYVIVCTDYLTKWVETKAVPSQTAVAVANFFVQQILLRHGAPATLLSDQGLPFLAAVTQEVLFLCQTRHVNTTAYNPACNGFTEPYNKVMSVMLSMYVNNEQTDWDENLAFITAAYNTSKQASTGFTPFYLLYGPECRSPLSHMSTENEKSFSDYSKKLVSRLKDASRLARENILKVQTGYILSTNQKRQPREFKIGDLVLMYTPVTGVGLSPKLVCHFFGPYRIINRDSRLNYQIESVRKKTRGKNVNGKTFGTRDEFG